MDNETATKVTADSDTFQTRLGLLKSRLKVAKAFSKKPHEAWKKWIAEYEIDDTSDTGEIRDKVRIGTIFRRVESDLPAIFDDQPDLFIKGKGRYRVFDDFFNNTYDWLWDIQMLEEKIEDTATYFDLLGMGFMDSPWVTETKTVSEIQQQPAIDPATGQPAIDPMTGQPVMQPVPVQYEVPTKDQPNASCEDPFKIHFSPETKFNVVLDYDHCPYYFKEHSFSKEKVKAIFGKDINPSETLNTDDSDLNTEIDQVGKKDNEAKDDIKRAKVYEYYGILPESLAKGIKGADGKAVTWAYDKDYHIWMTTNEELKAEECPYEVKPLLVMGNYGLANKFWKFGDAKHLMPLVQELQQYRRQILTHTRKMANPKPMIPTDADIDEAAFTDPNVGRMVKFTPSTTGEKPYYLSPANLGSEVGVGIQQVRTDIEQTSGTFSLSQGSGSSQVKTPRGIQTFSEASDRNVKRKRKKVARFIRSLLIFQFKQCAMNWKPDSPQVSDIVYGGEDQQQQPQMPMQQPQQDQKPDLTTILQMLGDDNVLSKVDIEIESLSVNKVEQKQEALDFFDVIVQHPDIFNVQEAARDLVQNGFNKKDADRYLISSEQMKAQAVHEFIMQIGQQNPQLGGALAKMIQQPNMMAMQQQNPAMPDGKMQPQLNAPNPAENGPPQG